MQHDPVLCDQQRQEKKRVQPSKFISSKWTSLSLSSVMEFLRYWIRINQNFAQISRYSKEIIIF